MFGKSKKEIHSRKMKVDIFDTYYHHPDRIHFIWDSGEWIYCIKVVASVFNCSIKEAFDFCESTFKKP